MEFRSDIIDIQLILRALKSLHKGSDAEMKINSFQSLNATTKGENFLGDLAALEVFARIEKGNQIQYRTFLWMVKMLKPNAGSFNLGRILGTFEFEAMVYQELIPSLNKVSSKVKLGTTVPMVYVQDTKGQEALILDHMKQYGWRDAKNKKQGLDLDHIQMAMEWLAKFHGLSHVLMQNQPDFLRRYKPMNQRLDEATKSMMKNARQNLAGRLTKSVALLETEGNKYTNWITGLFAKNVVIDDLKDQMQTPTEFGFNAICHLDTWFNNMLFQYNEKNQVQEVLFLDFQGSGYCNVGNDLAMLLLSSTTKEFRDQNLKKILMHYLQSLKDTVLTASDGQEDLKYSMEDLEKDYRFGLPVGLTFCFNALPMILCEPEDVIDFSTVDFQDVKAQKAFVANASDSFNKHTED